MKTIYLNLEDDVAKTIAKIRAQKSEDVVLVIPKDSYLLNDSINLRLLKKQVDKIGNKVSILTMDTNGQMYAKEAGFPLKRLPRISPSNSISDIRQMPTEVPEKTVLRTSVVKPKSKLPLATKPRMMTLKKSSISPNRTVTKTRIHSAPILETSRIFKKQVDDRIESSPVKKAKSKLQNNFFVPPENNNNSKLVQLKKPRSYKKYVLGFMAICLVVLVVLVTVILPSGSVVIYAKSQAVSRDLDVSMNSNIQTIDQRLLALPATSVSETKTVSDTFSVNGKKEVGAKAQGRIAIYNLTGSPLNLRATTTVLTVGSNSYYFTADQNGIVALSGPNNDSNATVADVTAQDAGESFNLPSGTRMEITNQSFGSQPQRLYAKTITQVIGGSSRFVSVVSEEDLNTAQQELVKKTVAEINENLPDNRKLVEGAYSVEITNFISDKPLDTETTSFRAEATVKITGLAFNQDDLKSVVRGRLQQNLGSDKILQDANLDTIINRIKTSDYSAGVVQLYIHYESKSLPVIDEQKIVEQLVGKSQQEANDILLTNQDIEKVDIRLAPTWQSTFPRLGSKIHLEIRK